MKPDEFLTLCRQLHELARELGVDLTDVQGGIFKASFRQPQAQPRKDREPKTDEPGQKRMTAPSPDQARHNFYARVLGNPDEGG